MEGFQEAVCYNDALSEKNLKNTKNKTKQKNPKPKQKNCLLDEVYSPNALPGICVF